MDMISINCFSFVCHVNYFARKHSNKTFDDHTILKLSGLLTYCDFTTETIPLITLTNPAQQTPSVMRASFACTKTSLLVLIQLRTNVYQDRSMS